MKRGLLKDEGVSSAIAIQARQDVGILVQLGAAKQAALMFGSCEASIPPLPYGVHYGDWGDWVEYSKDER